MRTTVTLYTMLQVTGTGRVSVAGLTVVRIVAGVFAE